MILFLHGVEEELALHTRLRLAPARGSRSSSGGDQAKPWKAQIKFAHVRKDTATKKYHEDFLNKMYLAVVGPCILPCRPTTARYILFCRSILVGVLVQT